LLVHPIPEANRQKLVSLVRQGVSVAAASRAAGMSIRAAGRIMAAADSAQSAAPFSGSPQGPANIPPPNYAADQPTIPERDFRPGYHDRTFTAYAAPQSFDGFNLARVRAAISMHRQGLFLESSTLAMVVAGFPPIFAALSQRVSPWKSIRKHVTGSNRGFGRVAREEVESQIAPGQGLTGSPHFPISLWGSAAFEKVMMGFGVLQHAYGEPDPETGVRPVYTRRWPVWAVQYYRYRRQMVAITSQGPVDILNDGKFTLIADNEEPHFFGAIVALGEEAIDGKATQRARASYIERYGNPKILATMPQGTAARTPEGEALLDMLAHLRNPDALGVVPNGTEVEMLGLESGRSTVMKDALESNIWMCAATILGSDGTISRGTGGVYSAPIFAGVRRDLVDDDMTTIVRAVNTGHIDPFIRFNYAATVAETRGWIQPALNIPLPDPDKDQRIQSFSTRLISFHKSITEERLAGFTVTQERVNQLAGLYEIEAPALTDPTGKTFPNVGTSELKPDTTEQAAGASGTPTEGDDGKVSDATGGGGGTSGDTPSNQGADDEGTE
jgi:hypothetical protein